MLEALKDSDQSNYLAEGKLKLVNLKDFAACQGPQSSVGDIGSGHPFLRARMRWKVNYPPSQHVGSGFEPHWRPQPAKLPLFGGYSLETLPYLTWSVFCSSALVPLKLVPSLGALRRSLLFAFLCASSSHSGS